MVSESLSGGDGSDVDCRRRLPISSGGKDKLYGFAIVQRTYEIGMYFAHCASLFIVL
jgi:hypothetical protein